MRLIVGIAIALLCGTVAAQDFYSADRPVNIGQAIGQGAIDAYALRAQVNSLQEEVRRLTGENEALRAQLRQRDAKAELTPAKKPTAKIVSAVRCESCPKIKAWLKPWLLKNGYAVSETTHEQFLTGKIYPYVEIEVCSGDTCRLETIMAPDTRTPFTQGWFEYRMIDKGLLKDEFVPAPAGD